RPMALAMLPSWRLTAPTIGELQAGERWRRGNPPVNAAPTEQGAAMISAPPFTEAFFKGSAALFASFIASSFATAPSSGAPVLTQPPLGEQPWLASPRHT